MLPAWDLAAWVHISVHIRGGALGAVCTSFVEVAAGNQGVLRPTTVTPPSRGQHRSGSAEQAELLLPPPVYLWRQKRPHPCKGTQFLLDLHAGWDAFWQCWKYNWGMSNRWMEEGWLWVSWLGWLVGEWADRQLLHLSSNLAQFLNHVKISFVCGTGERWQGTFTPEKFKLSPNQAVNQIQ